jgi:hypothetical protein
MNYDDELLHRCADGVATPDELSALATLMRDDCELRGRYLDLMNLDTALTAAADVRMDHESAPAATSRKFWLRPFTAAAAGLIIGVSTVSVVWAYAAPRQTRMQELPLVDASFETGSRIESNGVPDLPGRWTADPHEIVESHGKVIPHEGTHMLRFLAASSAGDHSGSKWSGADLYQVVELPGNGTRTVKIRAWFNADTASQARFHIAAVAGDGNGIGARELWAQRDIESASLAFGRSTTFVDRNPATWEVGNLTLQVPPQARVLVIGITSHRMPDAAVQKWFPAQFLDSVSVSISEEVQQ